MAELFDINEIQLILIFVMPGFISYKIWLLIVPSKSIPLKEYFLEIISYSCINFTFLFWLIILAEKTTGCFQVFLYLVILLVGPVIWPILWSKILKSEFLKGKIIHPTPKAWDYFFSLGKSCFMLIHLKSGKLIGGLYYKDSFASSYPEHNDLYLKEVWKINETGEFIEKIKGTEGMLINYNEIEYIELFNLNSEEGEDNV